VSVGYVDLILSFQKSRCWQVICAFEKFKIISEITKQTLQSGKAYLISCEGVALWKKN